MNAKTIITIHNPLPHESLWPLSFFEYYLFKSCDHLIVHNIEGKEVLLRLLGESCPDITIIPHGIDNESEVSVSHKLVPSSSYLLFAGNIRPYKGLDNLLDAWAIYDRESNENMQLIIAGKLWGDPKKGFNVFHKLLGMSRYARKILQKLEMANNVISYLNFIPEDEFNGLIQKADMIVLPYKHFHSESGIVSKALGFNISILVSRVVGLKRYASSEDYIIADTAALPFAKQLRYLIESSSNDASDLVKSHVRNASWDRVADAHINVYEKVSNIGEYQ